MTDIRKLAAILSADVVGYSRLMGDDDRATLATLTEYREVMREHIAARHGRVIDAPGDALLAEFPSAVQAVEAAVAIQRTLSHLNSQMPAHRRMVMRIGINLGDVIEQDSALYGDGVNIAARLEALCKPGGVCVSGTIFDQVDGKVPETFKFAGEQAVKNIAKPVRAYHTQIAGKKPATYRAPVRKLRLLAVGVSCAVLAALGIWQMNSPHDLAGTGQDVLLEMPSGPVVAVLPFTNMSGDPNEDYFSDGLTEDIITELARFREIHVLARNTTYQFKGQPVDVPTIARKLGAQYVLEGSVRKSTDRVRITAQLIDASTGSHLWADRFDRDYADVFEVQDEVTRKIVGTVAGGFGGLIQGAELSKSKKKSIDQMEAYELVLKTKTAVYTPDWFDKSTTMLERAITLDPDSARAHEEYAWVRMLGWIFRFDTSPTPPQEILENAIKAVRLDPNDPYARRTAAFGYYFKKQFDSFEREALAALALAPYNAEIFSHLGMLFTFNGQWDRGIALVTKANDLNSHSAAGWYHSAMHYDHYRKHEYKQALESARGHPGITLCETQYKYVAAYGQLGKPNEARPHWKNCEASVPNMSADWVANVLRIWNFQEPFIAHYMEGIKKAGFLCRSTPCG